MFMNIIKKQAFLPIDIGKNQKLKRGNMKYHIAALATIAILAAFFYGAGKLFALYPAAFEVVGLLLAAAGIYCVVYLAVRVAVDELKWKRRN